MCLWSLLNRKVSSDIIAGCRGNVWRIQAAGRIKKNWTKKKNNLQIKPMEYEIHTVSPWLCNFSIEYHYQCRWKNRNDFMPHTCIIYRSNVDAFPLNVANFLWQTNRPRRLQASSPRLPPSARSFIHSFARLRTQRTMLIYQKALLHSNRIWISTNRSKRWKLSIWNARKYW